MILVDANILIYAHIRTTSRHEAARTWLDARLNGGARVGLPWESLLAFLRVVTNPRVYPRPTPVSDAVDQVMAWLACETAWIPQPTERHADVLVRLLSLPGIRGKLIPDAHLAALAIENGLTLCSADGDFARFAALRWENPLAQ
ncbi:MAG TPA: type II toxin-antitoxin system VapC family toxin [Propylenella sp.]